MENQTRFNLNAAIENWRQELAGQANLTADVRRELEAHLRDTISEFCRHGLNNEESFWLARRRVGQPQQLGEEFAKADPTSVWRERVFWITAAFLAASVWNTLLSTMTVSLRQSLNLSLSSMWLLRVFTYLLNIVFPIGMAVLIVNGRMNRHIPKFAPFFQSRLRLAATVVMAVMVMNAIWTAILLWNLNLSGNHGAGYSIANVWGNLLFSTVQPLVCIAFLVWLMPAQNRKTPKRV
jgi:hypothetical protein